MSPKPQRKTPAQQRADAALDRVAEFSSTPTAKALDFLLRGSHDEPSVPDSLLEIGSPKPSTLPDSAPLAYPKTSLPKTSSPPQNEQPINLMSALPDVDGYTRFWHQMTDHLYRNLAPSEQAVHIQLFRLSWGHNNETCIIGLPNLAKRTGIAKTTVQRAIEGLIEKGLIEKTRAVFGKDIVQGIEYRVIPPPALLKTSRLPKLSSLPEMSTNKQTHIKETHKNTEGVSVASRFSLKECRKYAEHLRSTEQGITNPGGYATKIQRSGEADELIAAFLEPVASAPVVDTSGCPDCKGTGWYEPAGKGKGVAKCKHERLHEAG